MFADMENKVIYSMQGYTTPCKFYISNLEPLVEKRLIEVAGLGLNIAYKELVSGSYDVKTIRYGAVDSETIKKLIEEKRDKSFGYFVVDEYKIINYSESIAGATQMLSDMIDGGIPMSHDDIAEIKKYIDKLKQEFAKDYGYEYYLSCPDDVEPYIESF